MNSRDHRGRRFRARVFLAGLLLLGLITTSFPFATLASGPACTLACCAGLPSHAAGSCMGGSCHAGILPRETSPVVADSTAADEELCGLSTEVSRATIIPTVYADAEPETNGTEPQFSSPALTKSCQPDCGACLSAANNRNRQRESFAARSIEALTPPAHLEFKRLEHNDAKLRETLRYRGVPRGPPNSF